MTLQFAVSPDFPPDQLAGWFILNTWLQKKLGQSLHLEVHDSFAAQRAAIAAGRVDLIYANPHDASMLVREKGFAAIARPRGKCDEALVAVRSDHAARCVEDLVSGASMACTDHPDVAMMGMIMLEAADLHDGNIRRRRCGNYVQVARQLLEGGSEIGIFLADAFDALSPLIRQKLRVLVRGQIGVVQHLLLAGPALAASRDRLIEALMGMEVEPGGADMLASLGLSGWETVADEDVEFMIDLIETLAA